MQEKLDEIDTEVIDELARIKEDRDRIHGFRERAEDKEDEVEESVFRRVIADYDSRLEDLDKEARPLREQGRIEYRKLVAILESLDEELSEARSQKQEFQFRHEVGEISDEELAEQLEEPEAVIERCQAGVAEVDEIRDRFVEAFGSEEELESTEAEPVDEEAEDTEDAEGDEEAGEDEETASEEEEMEEAVADDATLVADASFREAVEAEAEAAESDATVVADASFREAMQEEAEEEDAAATIVAPNARLTLESDGDRSGEEFPLGPLNYVGRAPDNHVSVEAPAVSRKHALITASGSGFVIEDLGSPNGTFVNGEEIDGETELQDGDSVKLGNVEFRFHSP